jgi:hypothetical protein
MVFLENKKKDGMVLLNHMRGENKDKYAYNFRLIKTCGWFDACMMMQKENNKQI